LVRKPEGKRPLTRPGHKIKMDPNETGWEDEDCIHLDKDRKCWQALVNIGINLYVP
jgi:hypothetical protein